MTLGPAHVHHLQPSNEVEADRLDPARACELLREELRELEPVVTAATLVTVAFRMRDEAGLVAALRGLTQAVDELERARGEG